MADRLVHGVVIRYANFSESSRMLTLLTLEEGLVTAAAKGARRMKSQLRPAAEVFVFGEFVLHEGRSSTPTITSASIVDSFYDLRTDLDRLSCAMEMAELVLALAPEGQPSRRLFSLLVRSLGCLCYDEEDPFKIGLHFQIRAMACSGYGARLSTCAVCWDEVGRDASFSPADGGALCFKCASPIGLPPVSAGALKMLGNISTYDPDRLHVLNIPQELRADMKSLWQDYMRYHLNRHFRSPEFSKRLERFQITLNHKK